MTHDGRWRHALLLEKIIGEGQGRAQKLPTSGSSIFGQWVRSGDEKVGFREQIFEGLE
jgi:hypothetical protein